MPAMQGLAYRACEIFGAEEAVSEPQAPYQVHTDAREPASSANLAAVVHRWSVAAWRLREALPRTPDDDDHVSWLADALEAVLYARRAMIEVGAYRSGLVGLRSYRRREKRRTA